MNLHTFLQCMPRYADSGDVPAKHPALYVTDTVFHTNPVQVLKAISQRNISDAPSRKRGKQITLKCQNCRTISSYIEPVCKDCRRYFLIQNADQPCLCLCFGFSQIMRMLPLRLITLHFSQIGFTEERTFISFLLSSIDIICLKHSVRHQCA